MHSLNAPCIDRIANLSAAKLSSAFSSSLPCICNRRYLISRAMTAWTGPEGSLALLRPSDAALFVPLLCLLLLLWPLLLLPEGLRPRPW